jgi:glycosyltransferase involved in cell wall biosynthesis
MSNPLVSVIMPAYNGEKFIGKAIESVLSQTYSNLELIIIDDCSIDKTRSVIQSFTDPRIRFFENKDNSGIAYTTNEAIKASVGEYIALLDDDDIAMPDRLEKQVHFFETQPDVDVLGGASDVIDEYGIVLKRGGVPRSNPLYIKAMLLFQCVDFRNSTIMIRRSFIINHNLWYEDNCLGMQDYWFLIKASKIGTISSLPDCISQCRVHDNNFTDIVKNDYSMEREKLFGDFRKKSIELSGFLLSDEEINLLNKTMKEERFLCVSFYEWLGVSKIIISLIDQSQKKDCTFRNELKIYLMKKLCDMLRSVDICNDKDFLNILPYIN